ncbi:hypothetical protein [Butyrivibrio sp. VCB2006]|uniref:hypothetical protein n=1 Tax=Butyrivibrio sp. VCB2006 TaxID=1280679 RepID=UPI0012DF9524|nr:hypothetical protein [Butyrivibrio sp. VCB2006]
MQQNRKIINILTCFFLIVVIVFGCLIAFKLITEKDDGIYSDDRGDFTVDSLFDASYETLRYCGKYYYSGRATAFKVYNQGYDSKTAEIDYTFDYIDNDNYMGGLEVDIGNLSHSKEGHSWGYKYNYYNGKRDGLPEQKLDKNGSNSNLIIYQPEIEDILFPKITKSDASLERRGKETGDLNEYYAVKLKGNISSISMAVKSLIGDAATLERAEYFFDVDSHVLTEVHLYGPQTDKVSENGKSVPQFYMHLYLKQYGETEVDHISIPDMYYGQNAFNKILGNKRELILTSKLAMAGDTSTVDNLNRYWNKNVKSIWSDIYDYGNTTYYVKDLKAKAKEIGQKYGYEKVKMFYGAAGNPLVSDTMFLKLEFISEENGTGTLIIPQTMYDDAIRCDNILTSMGDDTITVYEDIFTVTRVNSDTNTTSVYGRYYDGLGFMFIVHEVIENPFSAINNGDDILAFPTDLGAELKSMEAKNEYSDKLQIGLYRFVNPTATSFAYIVRKIVVPTAIDSKDIENGVLPEDVTETFEKTFGTMVRDDEELQYSIRDITNGMLKDTTDWIEIF